MNSPNRPWDRDFQILLILTVALNIVPQLDDVPLWTIAVAILFLIWKTLFLLRGIRLPSRTLLYGFAIAGATGVFFENGTLLGPEPATSLLVFLICAKLLETNFYQDATFVISASYFLLMTHLLNSQSLATTVFMCVDIFLLTTLMYFMHSSDRRRGWRSFRPVFKIALITLPVWIFLFFAFPRFSTSMMNFNRQQKGQTGLSDSLHPGNIAQLAENDGIVFRVEFTGGSNGGKNINPERLYWRALYLDTGDGLDWTMDPNLHYSRPAHWGDEAAEKAAAVTAVPYSIYLEPMNSRRLMALEYSRSLEASEQDLHGNAILRRDSDTFELTSVALDRIHYSGTAVLQSPTQNLLSSDREKYLGRPEKLDPRILSLVQNLKGTLTPTASATQIAGAWLNWFQKQDFSYSLRPGPLSAKGGAAQLAEFLFEKKIGFCEHYAGAFATLVRLSGVPARVVVGYQGGRTNVLGHYTIVRSLDAHAWTEIWQDVPRASQAPNPRASTGHWIRFDPTSVIAPLRLQLGGDFNRLDRSLLRGGISEDELRRRLEGEEGPLYRVGLAWDLVQMRWNGFLLGYNLELQEDVLSRIGINKFSRLVLTGLVLVGLAFFFFIFRFIIRRRETSGRDLVLEAWHRLVDKLETNEFRKDLSENALAFTARAEKQWPQHASEIRRLAQAFNELRYGAHHADAREFIQSTRRFSISDNSP